MRVLLSSNSSRKYRNAPLHDCPIHVIDPFICHCFNIQALPSKWRRSALKELKQVVITIQGDELVIKPVSKCNLKQYFDAFEIDINPVALKDYKNLKKVLLTGKN